MGIGGEASIMLGALTIMIGMLSLGDINACMASELQTGKRAGFAPSFELKAGDVEGNPVCDTPEDVNKFSLRKSNNQKQNCLISINEVDKLQRHIDFSFVDVRTASEFEKYRLSDSINIPLHQIKTKGFLKTRTVVLVNEGRNTSELEAACIELRRNGFEKLSVLNGGLFAWNVANRNLEGNAFEQLSLNHLKPEELFELRTNKGLTVLDVSSTVKKDPLRKWLPDQVLKVPFKNSSREKSLVQIEAAIKKQYKLRPSSRLLLIADNNDVYELLNERLKKSKLSSRLLRLDGGINEYREYVARQQALWKQQEQDSQPRRYEACRG